MPLDDYVQNIWDRIAFCTRYGRITLEEAKSMEISEVQEFVRALGNLIEKENTVTED